MYYLSSKKKGIDQLCNYGTSDLRHCFSIGKNLLFSLHGQCFIINLMLCKTIITYPLFLQDLSGVAVLDDVSTATYFAILRDTGELMFGVGDMDIHSRITPEYVSCCIFHVFFELRAPGHKTCFHCCILSLSKASFWSQDVNIYSR